MCGTSFMLRCLLWSCQRGYRHQHSSSNLPRTHIRSHRHESNRSLDDTTALVRGRFMSDTTTAFVHSGTKFEHGPQPHVASAVQRMFLSSVRQLAGLVQSRVTDSIISSNLGHSQLYVGVSIRTSFSQQPMNLAIVATARITSTRLLTDST